MSTYFIGSLGGWEIAIIAIVVLVLFGGSKLAQSGKNAGKAIREFKSELHADEPKIEGAQSDAEDTDPKA